MTDLVFSKQIQKKQKLFPWLKDFQRKLLRNFPNDLELETLQFFLQNVKEEVTNLPKCGKTKRRNAIFEIVYDLFVHFQWRIQWKGRKKWSRRWKNVSSDIQYTEDAYSKCCEKLLYYIIYLGITLSQGAEDSEYIVKVFQAIHILPRFDSVIYSSLLLINKLNKMYHAPYIAILRHVLCTEVVVTITEPAVYIKIIVLLRRLKRFTNDKFSISALESTALLYKPPSDIILWMSIHAIEFPLEKLESFSKELLSNKSDDLFHKLYHVVTMPVNSQKKRHDQLHPSETIQSKNNKTKVKNCKHKRKSDSKVKLRDTQSNLSVDETSAFFNPTVHSETSTSLNCEMHVQTTITKKYKKFQKKTWLKSKNLFVRNLNRSTDENEPTVSNEMLNSMFDEYKQNIEHVLVKSNGKESHSLENFALPNESIVIRDVTSDFNEEQEQAKPCNGSSSHNKIELYSNTTYKQNQSIHKSNLHESENTNCLNSLVTLGSNNLKNSSPIKEICTNECTNKTTDAIKQDGTHLLSFQCFSNGNLCGTGTFENQISSSQTQRQETSPDKITFVSSVETQTIYSSTSLNFVQQSNEDSTPKPCEASTNALYESSINSNQIHTNDNLSMSTPANNSSSILQPPRRLKALCDVPSYVFHENNSTTHLHTDKAIASTGINANENICRNGEKNINYPNSANSSADFCNNADHCGSWMGNQSNSPLIVKGRFGDHQWEESQPLVPKVYRSSKPTQNCLVNYTKSSLENSEVSYVNSFVAPHSESRMGDIIISQNNTSGNCVVDCKIVRDYEPNTQQQENVTSFKVVINVSCQPQEVAPNQQSGHIFGNFNNSSENYFDSSQNQVISKTQNIQNHQNEHTLGNFTDASKNFYPSQNLFGTANPTSEIPKLKPFFHDPPRFPVAVPLVATPPDSELEISILSSRQSENKFLTNSYFENPQNKPKDSSTPKSTFRRRISVEDNSDFRTPQTSDCESSDEDNEENINLIKSPVTRTSNVKCTVDDILERLKNRKRQVQGKLESHSSTSAQDASTENASYKSFTDVYFNDDLSDDSTISRDDKLNKYYKTSGVRKQKPLNVIKKRKKNENSKKQSEDDQKSPEKTPSNISCGYNLRPRKKTGHLT